MHKITSMSMWEVNITHLHLGKTALLLVRTLDCIHEHQYLEFWGHFCPKLHYFLALLYLNLILQAAKKQQQLMLICFIL